MPEMRAVKDLAIGDLIQVDGFEGDQLVRKAKKIRTGLDTGLFEVTLAAADGATERIALAAEGRVTVVGRDPGAMKGKRRSQGKAQGKAKTKARAQPEAAAASASPAAATPAPRAEAKTAPQARGRQPAKAEKHLSCLEAAAKLLRERGQPMTCPELIAAMAAKGYWTSPAGKTPAATLYAAVVREIDTKKDRARFRKTEPGKFALA